MLTDGPLGAGRAPSPALVAKGIQFSYGDTQAVRGISFQVNEGEILGLLGPNGAGKSTTIKILTGQLRPDAGKVFLLGREMSVDDPDLQSRIGVCFEEKNLYLNMTARENLVFFSKMFGIRDFDPDSLMDLVDLKSAGDRRVGRFSKGMKQRLMVARALLNRPEVLFLDEPTDGLDPVSSRTLRSIIKRQAENGTAVLLTTHDMWEADELSHRVAFMNDGLLHAVERPEVLKQKYGRRSVRFSFCSPEGDVSQESVELGSPGFARRIADLSKRSDLLSIHTEEATLEDIFVEITGRGLST